MSEPASREVGPAKTEPPEGKHWDALEKLLLDNYRKEIDQEENVWRSLPFFIGGLALELTIVFQSLEKAASGPMWSLVVCLLLLGGIAIAALAACYFLYVSIRSRAFKYLADEPGILAYVSAVEDFRDVGPAQRSVAWHLQRLLIEQLAPATDNNRRINQERMKARMRAGVLMLVSLVMAMMLAILAVANYILGRVV